MSLVASSALFAHQGGWDEIALVVGPIVVIAALLILAKRRVDAAMDDRPKDPSGTGRTAD